MVGNSLWVNETVRKREWGWHVARENIERGAEGGMARENVVLWKLAMILVLYGAGAEVDVETGLVLKQSILCQN